MPNVPQLTVSQMEEFANTFLKENFNLSLKIPISVNNRLTRSLGRLLISKGYYSDYAVRIEISGRFLKYNSKEDILDTIKHECVHYALFILKKPYTDDSYEFISTCKRLGVGLSGSKKLKAPGYTYACSQGCKFSSQRRKNLDYIICKKHNLQFTQIS